jgi:hypothetical protein
MPKPTAQHQHGTGDRNDDPVAREDEKLQEHRDAIEQKDASEADLAAKRDMGIEHP